MELTVVCQQIFTLNTILPELKMQASCLLNALLYQMTETASQEAQEYTMTNKLKGGRELLRLCIRRMAGYSCKSGIQAEQHIQITLEANNPSQVHLWLLMAKYGLVANNNHMWFQKKLLMMISKELLRPLDLELSVQSLLDSMVLSFMVQMAI